MLAKRVPIERMIKMFCLQKIDDRTFEIYHAVYASDNLFLHYDWNQMLDNFTPHGNGYLLLKDDIPIGGAAIRKGKITAPFLIAPYITLQNG